MDNECDRDPQCGVLLTATSGPRPNTCFSLYDWLFDDFSSERYLIGVRSQYHKSPNRDLLSGIETDFYGAR